MHLVDIEIEAVNRGITARGQRLLQTLRERVHDFGDGGLNVLRSESVQQRQQARREHVANAANVARHYRQATRDGFGDGARRALGGGWQAKDIMGIVYRDQLRAVADPAGKLHISIEIEPRHLLT